MWATTKCSSLSTLRDAQQESSLSSSGNSVFTRCPGCRKLFLCCLSFFFSISLLFFFLSSIFSYLTPSLAFRSHFSISVHASYQTWSINFAGHLIWLHSVTQQALKEAVEVEKKFKKKKKNLSRPSQTERQTDGLTRACAFTDWPRIQSCATLKKKRLGRL